MIVTMACDKCKEEKKPDELSTIKVLERSPASTGNESWEDLWEPFELCKKCYDIFIPELHSKQ